MQKSMFLLLISFLFYFLAACPSNTHWSHSNGVYFDGGRPVRWHTTDFPLIISSDESVDQADRVAMQQAAVAWNRRVGGEVFIYSENADAYYGHIRFNQSDIPNINGLGFTQAICHQRSDGGYIQDVVISIDLLTTPEESAIVLTHELGHALGLTHDTYAGSIMYYSAISSSGRILDDDVGYVRWQMREEL